MRTALETLDLERLYVVYPGDRAYRLHDRIDVHPIKEWPSGLYPYRGHSQRIRCTPEPK
jgi:hypothetical protein